MASLPFIFIDIGDSSKGGIKAGLAKDSNAPRTPQFRGDGGEARYIFAEKTGQSGKPYRNADLTSYVIEGCIAETDEAVTAGTFGLSYSGNSTGLTALAFDISAAALSTALNANAAVTTAGGVTVTKHGDYHFRIKFVTTGAKSLLVSDPTLLTPSGQVYVIRAITGDGSTKEVQWLRIVQSPLAYTSGFSAEAAGTVVVTTPQAGTSSRREIQRVTIGEYAYDGSFILNAGTAQEFTIATVENAANILQSSGFILEDSNGSVGVWINVAAAGTIPDDIAACDRQIEITTIGASDGANLVATLVGAELEADGEFTASVVGNVIYVAAVISGDRTEPRDSDSPTGFTFAVTTAGTTISASVPYDANAREISSQLGTGFTVVKNGFSWDITFPNVGNQATITVDYSGVSFFTTYLASLGCNTDAAIQRFADSDDDSIDASLEYSITPPGGEPVTIYKQAHVVYRDSIGTGNSSGSPSFGGMSTGNTTWVDQINGNDTTGVVGRLDKPFETLTAAADAVDAYGVDSNVIVLPGTTAYDEKDLLRATIITWIAHGAIIEYTGSSNGSLFDDGATGLAAESAAIVIGGTWKRTGSGSSAFVVNLDNGSTIEFREAQIEATANTADLVDGLLILRQSRVVNESGSANPINITNAGGSVLGFNSFIVANAARDSIEASTAVNVKLMNCWANTNPDANVTNQTAGGLTVDSNVEV